MSQHLLGHSVSDLSWSDVCLIICLAAGHSLLDFSCKVKICPSLVIIGLFFFFRIELSNIDLISQMFYAPFQLRSQINCGIMLGF